MKLFIISVITGFVGLNIGSAFHRSDPSVFIFGFAGFMLPYAIVLEKIYKFHSEKTGGKDTL